jgi:hypothetical protein
VTYVWECPDCGNRYDVVTTIENRDDPQFCMHVDEHSCAWLVKMRRIPATFLFTANREADKPENDIYRVAYGAKDAKDALEIARAEEKREARRAEEAAKVSSQSVDLEKSSWLDDCDVSGAWTAAHAGPEQLARWRKDNIPVDDFAKV